MATGDTSDAAETEVQPASTVAEADVQVTSTTAAPAADVAEVSENVDGDTLYLKDGRKVRLIGVDTPETQHPSKPVECFGPEAKKYTAAEFPPGTKVRVLYDVERQDQFDRELVYLYREPDGLFLNLDLVSRGFARVATFPPNVVHRAAFERAEGEAKAKSNGLWGACIPAPAPAPTPAPAPVPLVSPTPPPAPPTTAAPAPPATTAPQPAQAAFRNCTEARNAGAAPVHRGDPGYGSHLDRDGDGVACE